MPGKIAVEVAYALPEKQYLQRVTLQEGATVEEAIRASGLLELRTDIDLTKNKVGIYIRQNSAILCMMAIGWRFIVLSLPIRKSFAGNEQKNQRINNRQKKGAH